MRPGATWPTIQRFTGSKGAHVAEPTHPLDFQRFERGINLVVPLFANGLQLRHNALPHE